MHVYNIRTIVTVTKRSMARVNIFCWFNYVVDILLKVAKANKQTQLIVAN